MEAKEDHDAEWKWLLLSAVLCGVFVSGHRAGAGSLCQPGSVVLPAIYAAGGWDAVIDTWQNVRRGKLEIHFLMLAVAVGAAVIGAWWEELPCYFCFR